MLRCGACVWTLLLRVLIMLGYYDDLIVACAMIAMQIVGCIPVWDYHKWTT